MDHPAESWDRQAFIRSYRPQSVEPEVWAVVGEAVKAWVSAASSEGRSRTTHLLGAASRLAAWAHGESVPLGADTVLRDTTIERFCAVAERDGSFSATTRATIRSRLRFLAEANGVREARQRPPELRRGVVKAPYTEAEVSGFWQLPRAQRPDVAVRLSGLLAASLGAGCGPADFRGLRGTAIEVGPDGAVAVVLPGPRGRRVLCRDLYAAALRDAAAEVGDELLVGGFSGDRRNVTTGLIRRIEGGADLPHLEVARLRSTWIAVHLEAGTRLDVLMAAAGLTTPTSIVDLVRHLTPPPPEDAAAQLRLAGSDR